MHVSMCISGNQDGQKRAVDSLELELQALVSHRVGAGTEPGPSAEQPVLSTVKSSLLLPIELFI